MIMEINLIGFSNFPHLNHIIQLRGSPIPILIVLISVQSPPFIIKQPPTTEVLFKVKARADENDKPFVIECEAEGEPQPQWVNLVRLLSAVIYIRDKW